MSRTEYWLCASVHPLMNTLGQGKKIKAEKPYETCLTISCYESLIRSELAVSTGFMQQSPHSPEGIASVNKILIYTVYSLLTMAMVGLLHRCSTVELTPPSISSLKELRPFLPITIRL